MEEKFDFTLEFVSASSSKHGYAHTPMTRLRDTPVIVVALRGHRTLTHSATHPNFCCLWRSHLTLLVVDRSMVLEPQWDRPPERTTRDSVCTLLQRGNRVACACLSLDCADSCLWIGLPTRNHQAADDRHVRRRSPLRLDQQGPGWRA